ncbi:unnamed protein product [Closterium sp. Naga37s-1]|nr:unnamed protein product [Closterium sp. Naga37s-1]
MAWEPHPDIDLVPRGGEGSSKPPTALPSTVSTAPVKRPRPGTTYKQQTLWGAPPPRDATSNKRHAPSADPKPPTALADAEYESVKKTFGGQWAGSFKWLRLLGMSNSRPSLKCTISVKHGDPLAHTAYGAKGEGARDLQIGSIRTHSATRAHKNVVENQEKAEAEKAKQATLTRWQTTDASTRHIIRLLHIALFVCKADAPIAMFVPLCWFLSKEGLPDLPPGGDYGTYYTEEALAASDAAEEVPELLMIDDVVRAFADHIGRSSVDYQKFQVMQRIFCQTNLEAQGISDRGEAIQRLLDVLPAAIVVDVTLVAHIVQQTRMRLKTRYSLRDPSHHFGGGEKMQLPEFIQRHQAKDKREMKAEGVDGDGNPVTFEFTLHERPLP